MQEPHISTLQVDFNNKIIVRFIPIQNNRYNYSFVCCKLERTLKEFIAVLIFMWFLFWLVIVFPKYMNFGIFQSDLLFIFLLRFSLKLSIGKGLIQIVGARES